MKTNYLKFSEGENRIRIIKKKDCPTFYYGLERWRPKMDAEGKPMISQKTKQIVYEPVRREIVGQNILGRHVHRPFEQSDYRLNDDGTAVQEKEFIAFLAYNYATGRVEVAVVTAATIINFIKNATTVNARTKNSYLQRDLIVRRDGKDMTTTRYALEFGDVEETDFHKSVQDEIDILDIDLKELFRNGDPFEPAYPPYELYKPETAKPEPAKIDAARVLPESPREKLERDYKFYIERVPKNIRETTENWLSLKGGLLSLNEDVLSRLVAHLTEEASKT